jgi:hypothetical protein
MTDLAEPVAYLSLREDTPCSIARDVASAWWHTCSPTR